MTNGKQIKNKELLKMFCDERIETALQTLILNKKEYSDMNKESIEIYAYAQQLGFTAKQFLVFDQAVAIANARGGMYGDEAYYQGFEDGIRLLSEILHIKPTVIDTAALKPILELLQSKL